MVFLGLKRLIAHSKKEMALIGFGIGLVWFYWIALSFRYIGFEWAVGIGVIVVALFYGVLFGLIGWSKAGAIRALVMLFAFDLLAPLGFDWFRLEVLVAPTLFGVDKLSLGLLLGVGASLMYIKALKVQVASVILLLFAFDLQSPPAMASQEITLISTPYAQDEKWALSNRQSIIHEALNRLEASSSPTLLFPETVFPTYLNRDPELMDFLLMKSETRAIVAGGLYWDGTHHYNSTYIFHEGNLTIAHKVYLVPFGERTDFLPSVLGEWVNTLFYNGAEDYRTAKTPTDVTLYDESFRIAICYEATVEAMFRDAPPFILALSNNAWYDPSIQPTLQYLVMLSLARKYNKVIYHATNRGRSEVIRG